MSGEIIKHEKNSQEKKETRMNYNCESAAESSVRMLALSERPSFNGENVESAKQFMKDLEELFDLVRITDPMLKKYHFKSELSGLSTMWYDSLDDPSTLAWSTVKEAKIHWYWRLS